MSRSDRRTIIGSLIERLPNLPLAKLRLLADAAECWLREAERSKEKSKKVRAHPATALESNWTFGRSQTESNGET